MVVEIKIFSLRSEVSSREAMVVPGGSHRCEKFVGRTDRYGIQSGPKNE